MDNKYYQALWELRKAQDTFDAEKKVRSVAISQYDNLPAHITNQQPAVIEYRAWYDTQTAQIEAQLETLQVIRDEVYSKI